MNPFEMVIGIVLIVTVVSIIRAKMGVGRDKQGNEKFARVKVPDTLPQLVPLQAPARSPAKRRSSTKPLEFVWIEQLIAANLDKLFPGMQILEVHPFHITRDADMAIKELEAEDLLETIEEGVRQRRFGVLCQCLGAAGQLLHGMLQGGFHQIVLGFEMGVEAAVGQAQRLHQRLQAGGTDAVAAKAQGRLLDDALMSLGLVIFRIAHGLPRLSDADRHLTPPSLFWRGAFISRIRQVVEATA